MSEPCESRTFEEIAGMVMEAVQSAQRECQGDTEALKMLFEVYCDFVEAAGTFQLLASILRALKYQSKEAIISELRTAVRNREPNRQERILQ